MRASDVVTRVRHLLMDPDAERWTDQELLLWLADGQLEITVLLPEALTEYVSALPVLHGSNRQQLSLPYTRPIQLHWSYRSDVPVTSRVAMRLAERDQIDAVVPLWAQNTRGAYGPMPHSWSYDPREQSVFYIYPAPETGSPPVFLAATVARRPAFTITSLSATLDLADIWLTPLVDYVMYRAHSKESDFAAGIQLATAYYQSFTSHVGLRDAAELQANPNRQIGPSDSRTKVAAQ